MKTHVFWGIIPSLAGFLLTSGAIAAPTPNGRLLAAQCFQCHGPNGRSISGIDSIAGESAKEIVEEMKEMQAKALREPDIMHSQALIYTDEEIQALAGYLASLRQTGASNSLAKEEEESKCGKKDKKKCKDHDDD